MAINVGSQQSGHQRETSASSSGNFAVTSRLHHVEDSAAISRRLHRGTTRPRKPSRDRDLSAGAGRGSRTPKDRSPADFESAASASSAIPALNFQAILPERDNTTYYCNIWLDSEGAFSEMSVFVSVARVRATPSSILRAASSRSSTA